MTFSEQSEANTGGASCEIVFKPIYAPPDAARVERREAFKVIPKFKAYFKAINEQALEREYIIELQRLVLLAREHILLLGPPGNGKSQVADLAYGNITLDGKEKSYFRIQMTPETTMSETHGPMDYKALADTGEYKRLNDQGMGAKRNIFIDEIFDARPNAQRNILGLLAERSHAQGSHIIKADIESVVGASNLYLSQVYEKAGDDRPRATLDRFAVAAFVPATFEFTKSYVELSRRSKKPQPALPPLLFSELDSLRAILSQVEIPTAIGKVLTLLSSRMKAETEALEAASLKAYREKIKNGEEPSIPYRATKFHSPRTFGKAAAFLQAIVVDDWVRKNGKRKLEATMGDVAQLQKFFTLNGPRESFVKSEMARTSDPHERAQLMTILQEREIFERHYNKIVEEMDGASVLYALETLSGVVSNAKTKEQREVAAQKVIAALAKVVTDNSVEGLQSELNGEEIGREFVQNYMEGLLKGLVTREEFKTMKSDVLDEIERQKRAALEKIENERLALEAKERAAAQEIAKKEAAARMEAERAAKRAEEFRALYADPEKYDIGIGAGIDISDPRNGNGMVAYNAESEQLAYYNVATDRLFVFSTATLPGNMSLVLDRSGALGNEKSGLAAIRDIKWTANAEELVFFTEDGKAALKFNRETENLESVPLATRNVATTLDHVQNRVISFDPSTLKLKVITYKDGAETQTTETYKFVTGRANAATMVTEESFKPLFTNAISRLVVSDNGKYAVLSNPAKQYSFVLDFEKKQLTPLLMDAFTQGSVTANAEADRSILMYSNANELRVLDVSGSAPVIHKLKYASPLNVPSMGLASIAGTTLLLGSKGNGIAGTQLIDGLDGSVLSDAFIPADLLTYGLRAVKGGYVILGVASGRWSLGFVRMKK